MKKKVSVRTFLTASAEIAAIVSCCFTAASYYKTKNIGKIPWHIGTFWYISLAVSIISLVILSYIIVLALSRKVKKHEYILKHKLTAYIKSDPEYLRRKPKNDEQELLKKTRDAIKKLEENITFEQDVYYMLLYMLFHTANRNINVVSILAENEWIDTPEEEEFLRVNLAVVDRKIHLNRVFVVNEADVKKKLDKKSIKSFIEADETYMHLFVVFREDLSDNMQNSIGSGYIDFEDGITVCDEFSRKEIRGKLIMNKGDVEAYHTTFMSLSQYYRPINKEFIQKYL